MAHRFSHNYEIGLVGVQIFFILSGFLIGQILINDFKNEGKLATVLKFWKRRWYRTLPLYYLILIFKILIFSNPFGWKILVYFIFFQANFVGIDFFPVSWSLIVEEWFYIFLPLATLFFFSKGIRKEKLLYFLIGSIVFFLLVRFLWNYLHFGIIIYQFDCLLLGVLVALIKMHYSNIYCKLNSVFVFLIGLIGVIGLTYVFGKLSQIPLYSPFYRVIWYFTISVFISMLIPFVESSTFINIRIKKIKSLYFFITWTSILTYSIYLIHGDIFIINFNLSEIPTVILHFTIIYVISFILYIFYEHPMTSLREKFSFDHYTNTIKSFNFKLQ